MLLYYLFMISSERKVEKNRKIFLSSVVRPPHFRLMDFIKLKYVKLGGERNCTQIKSGMNIKVDILGLKHRV
ncbi:MAG: hypothetical protein ACPGWR_24680, partial [Ardenticatenaceae bacterium]